MKRKVLFTGNTAPKQWNMYHNTKMSINGWTISYGCAPLNKIEPKLQFMVKKKKNKKKVTRIETQFHIR